MAEETSGKDKKKLPEYELILLADVDIHRYTSLVGDTAKAAAELDVDQITDREWWVSKGASKQLGDLVATGFIAPSDLAMLDTTAEEAKQIETRHGKDALRSLTTVGTPKRARLKSELYRKKRQEQEAAAAGGRGTSAGGAPLVPVEERMINEETKLEELSPSVAIYYMFMQKAAERRALTRKRRRTMVSLRRQADLGEHLALMRGVEPVRKQRKIARTGVKTADGHGKIKEGEFYIENGILTTYFFDQTTNKWHKLAGAAQHIFGAEEGETEPDQGLIDIYSRLCDLDDDDERSNSAIWCQDATGNRVLNCHPSWYEYMFPTERNFPFCQGLCRYLEGWVAPEGIDGISSILDLVYDDNAEAIATHYACKSCGLRLCAKCYKIAVSEHHGCVWELIRMYAEWREHIYQPWLRQPAIQVAAALEGGSAAGPLIQPKPMSYITWFAERRKQRNYAAPTDSSGTVYFDPVLHGKKSGDLPADHAPESRPDSEAPQSFLEKLKGAGKEFFVGGSKKLHLSGRAGSQGHYSGGDIVMEEAEHETDRPGPPSTVPRERRVHLGKAMKANQTASNSKERISKRSGIKGGKSRRNKTRQKTPDFASSTTSVNPFMSKPPRELESAVVEEVDELIEADRERRMLIDQVERERPRDASEELGIVMPLKPSLVDSNRRTRRITRSVSRR